MPIPKQRAIELLTQKLRAFAELKRDAKIENSFGECYDELYFDTEELIENLFGSEKRDEFRMSVTFGTAIYDNQKENAERVSIFV